jgi:catechol 2,3-dioxygenase-like lactoylglutathione lyase family enzyme
VAVTPGTQEADVPEPAKMFLEMVCLPVADVDRAKAFYVDQLDFKVDVDIAPSEGVRIVQLTPPGSACSINLSSGLPEIAAMTPGSVRALHLVVKDAVAIREQYLARGVECDEVEEHPGGMKFVRFADPDGNSWLFQEMPWRAGDFG